MKVTRRSLAHMLAVAAAQQTGRAQVTIAQPNPPADPDMQSARDQMQSNTQQIAKVKLPMATEPAFHFKA